MGESDSQLLPESEPPDPEPDDSNVNNLVESTNDPKPWWEVFLKQHKS